MNEDIKSAIDAPRPHHQLLPMKIHQEMGTPKNVVDYLRKVGHEVDIVDVYKIDGQVNDFGGSRIQGIAVDENGITQCTWGTNRKTTKLKKCNFFS